MESPEDLSARRSRRVKHHSDDGGVVGAEIARVPPVHSHVDQLLRRVNPGILRCRVYHVLLIVSLGFENTLDGHLWTEYVPRSVRGQDQASVLENVQIVNVQVWVGRHDIDVIFGIVGPEIAEGASDCQERDLVDVSRSSDGTGVAAAWTIPNHPGDSRLGHDFAAGLLDSGELGLGLGLVVDCEPLGTPSRHVIGITLAKDDARIADMTDEQFAPLDEADRGRRAGGRGQAGGGLAPVREILPHSPLCFQESLSDGS